LSIFTATAHFFVHLQPGAEPGRLALQICKDCRCNVMRAYKDLKPCARDQKAGEQPVTLEICAGHSLSVVEGLVCVDGKATTEFFEQAEEVEECNVSCSSQTCQHALTFL